MSDGPFILHTINSKAADFEEALGELNDGRWGKPEKQQVAAFVRQHLIDMMSYLEQTGIDAALSHAVDAFEKVLRDDGISLERCKLVTFALAKGYSVLGSLTQPGMPLLVNGHCIGRVTEVSGTTFVAKIYLKFANVDELASAFPGLRLKDVGAEVDP